MYRSATRRVTLGMYSFSRLLRPDLSCRAPSQRMILVPALTQTKKHNTGNRRVKQTHREVPSGVVTQETVAPCGNSDTSNHSAKLCH